jgi:hypothetical protein
MDDYSGQQVFSPFLTDFHTKLRTDFKLDNASKPVTQHVIHCLKSPDEFLSHSELKPCWSQRPPSTGSPFLTGLQPLASLILSQGPSLSASAILSYLVFVGLVPSLLSYLTTLYKKEFSTPPHPMPLI